MFDSDEYSWKDLNVALKGRVIGGILRIRYKEARVTKVIYAKGNKPRKIARGNFSYEGDIKLLQSELEALVLSMPLRKDGLGKKSILEMRDANVVAAYLPEDSLLKTTDILKGVVVLEVDKGMDQGDPNMEITLPIVFLDLIPQAASV